MGAVMSSRDNQPHQIGTTEANTDMGKTSSRNTRTKGTRAKSAGRGSASATSRARRTRSGRFHRWLNTGTARHRRIKRIATTAVAAMLAVAVMCSLAAAYNTFVRLRAEIAQAKATQAQLANEYGFDPGAIISDAVFFDGTALDKDGVQAVLDKRGADCTGKECLRNYTETVEAIPADDLCDGYPVNKGDKDYNSGKASSGSASTGSANSGKASTSSGQSSSSESESESESQSSSESDASALTPTATHTAAQIIANAAKSCSINPKVLLVMLEKEQGLVSATAPTQDAYDSALGLSCPDGAACDPKYSGFFKQVYGAAERFRYYLRHADQYGYHARRLNYVAYNPDASCGGANVWIENDATALLYIYTPYQPNMAALAAGAGEGDECSSYGNRNFKLLYDAWFG